MICQLLESEASIPQMEVTYVLKRLLMGPNEVTLKKLVVALFWSH